MWLGSCYSRHPMKKSFKKSKKYIMYAEYTGDQKENDRIFELEPYKYLWKSIRVKKLIKPQLRI